MKPLMGKMILALVDHDYEDLELWYPVLRCQEAGAKTIVAGELAGHEYRGKHGYPCRSDAAIADVLTEDFEGLIVPGGWMPDALRRNEHVLSMVRSFHQNQKMIATICHGPWILISAGICRDVRMTSTPGIKDDLKNAGAKWVDEPVVVDHHVISSRRPSGLPAFAERMIAMLTIAGR